MEGASCKVESLAASHGRSLPTSAVATPAIVRYCESSIISPARRPTGDNFGVQKRGGGHYFWIPWKSTNRLWEMADYASTDQTAVL